MNRNKLFATFALIISAFSLQKEKTYASDVPESEEQHKIRKLILDNIPDHSFPPPKKRTRHTGSSVNLENTVNLSHEELTDEKMTMLVEKIITDPYREEIQLLNLSNNQISNSGAVSLAGALDYLKNLKELDITENPIQLFGLQCLFIKAPKLKNLSSIKYSHSEKEHIPELVGLLEGKIKIDALGSNFVAHFNKQP